MEERRLGGPWYDKDGNYHPTTQVFPKSNIFENAYFGKAYKTRDGRKALYWCHDGHRHKLITEDNKAFQPWCNDDGLDYGGNRAEGNSPFDIISEWKEEVNEKELDKLAEIYAEEFELPSDVKYACKKDFKAGYRKALE